MTMRWGTETIAAALVVLAACKQDGDAEGADDDACQGPKCDAVSDSASSTETGAGSDDGGSSSEGTTGGDPNEVEPACYDRRLEAFNPNRLSFTPTALRWSCADIDSTPANERGQEYCEYFAIVTLPPTPSYPDPTPE